MSKKCSICGRGPRASVSRSHSNVATKKWQYLNLQVKKISGKRVKVCVRCLKNLKRKSNPKS